MPAQCMIAAIDRGDSVMVPGADDVVREGDIVVLIGPHGIESELKKAFLQK